MTLNAGPFRRPPGFKTSNSQKVRFFIYNRYDCDTDGCNTHQLDGQAINTGSNDLNSNSTGKDFKKILLIITSFVAFDTASLIFATDTYSKHMKTTEGQKSVSFR